MKRFFLCIYVCLAALLCGAQQTNVIKVPDIAALADRETSLCIYLNNMSNDIVAMQMELMLPQGMTIDASSAALSNRAVDHVLQVKPTNGGYRFMVYSPQNQPLRGNSGLLLTVNARLDDQFLSDNEYPMTISGATLGDSDGNNVLTSTECGSIIIQPSPDFVVTTLTASPQNISPEGEIMLSWTVKNQGLVASTGGWSEQILLVDDNGGKILLGRTFFDDPLQAGEAISRQATIKVPQLPGLEGNVKAQIQLAPNRDSGERPENQTNNTKTSGDILFLSKYIFLEMPTMVSEGNRTATCKLLRSGSWQNEESFSFILTGDDRLTVPQIVTIAQGSSSAYFNLVITDNELLDNDSIFKISIEGNGYPVLQQQLIIEDNEYPNLALSASKSQLTEGETFQLTVSTSRVSMYPITVTISSESSKRFNFPATVTIPAGKTSVTFDVTAVDDELPSLELSNAFTASAPKHNKAEVIVLLGDNDLPILELSISPLTLSESAGPVAMMAVLRRTTHKDQEITIRMSDDSSGHDINFGQFSTISMPKGLEEVTFSLGINDNLIVDGDRNVTITAAVYIQSCSCSASGEDAGVVSQTIHIIDNDGPSLTLTSSRSMILEGSAEGTVLTISRNTSVSDPLTVSITSNYDEGLDYTHSVTIPAGERTVKVSVKALANMDEGDSSTIVFTAKAKSHSDGTCWLMVSDQTLPDAIISSVELLTKDEKAIGDDGVMVNDWLQARIYVENAGVIDLPAGIPVTVYQNSRRVTSLTTSQAIAPGQSATLTCNLKVSDKVGTLSVHATVNEEQTIHELLYANNTSATTIVKVNASFMAMVSVDKNILQEGDSVTITGSLIRPDGTVWKTDGETTVALYLIADGQRFVQNIVANENGNFSYVWKPLHSQMGHIGIGACYPGETLRDEMASVDIYGMRRSSTTPITLYTILDQPYSGTISIINPGRLPLTGFTISTVENPDGATLSFDAPQSIAGGETVNIGYTLTGCKLGGNNDWQTIKLRMSTAEGPELSQTIYYYTRNLQAQLSCSVQQINTTMIKGSTRDYAFNVANIGMGSSGTVTLSLPQWMQSVTPSSMGSLEQGDTAQVIIRFVPTDDMQLNVPVTGQIGINCENANGLAIPFRIEPVSESTGNLIVDVCDEYTYYTAEAPHVSGATVSILHPITGAVVAQDITDTQGLFVTTLPEGYYTLVVTHPKHDSYRVNFLLDPGKTTSKVVNLTIDAIEVSWDVVETTVEDTYEIVTTVKYETNVPAPVVLVNVPDNIPAKELDDGESLVFYAVLTNVGLITAKGVQFEMPEGFNVLTFEPLDFVDETFDLAPQQSVTIPVKVTNSGEMGNLSRARRIKPVDNDPCYAKFPLSWFYECGTDSVYHKYPTGLRVGKCESNPTASDNKDDDGGGGGGDELWISGWYDRYPNGVGRPNYPSLNVFTSKNSQTKVSTGEPYKCTPCSNTGFLALAKLHPLVGGLCRAAETIKDIYNCTDAAINEEGWHDKFANCKYTKSVVDAYDRYTDTVKDIYNGFNDVFDSADRIANHIKNNEFFTRECMEDWKGIYHSFYKMGKDVVDLTDQTEAIVNETKSVAEGLDHLYEEGKKMQKEGEEFKKEMDRVFYNSSDLRDELRLDRIADGTSSLSKKRQEEDRQKALSEAYEYADQDLATADDYVNFLSNSKKIVSGEKLNKKEMTEMAQSSVRITSNFLFNARDFAEEAKTTSVNNQTLLKNAYIDNTNKLVEAIPAVVDLIDATLGECEYEGASRQKSRAVGRKAMSVNFNKLPQSYQILVDDLMSAIDMIKNAQQQELEFFGSPEWLNLSSTQLAPVAWALELVKNDGEKAIENPNIVVYCPEGISEESFIKFLERYNNTLKKRETSAVRQKSGNNDNVIDLQRIAELNNSIQQEAESIIKGENTSIEETLINHFNTAYDELSGRSNTVCASITLQFNQTMTMTRQAFRGTLKVHNGNPEEAMKDIILEMEIRNAVDGSLATSREMQINAESLDGFEGLLNLTDGWTLAANGDGTATILFIPSKYAAPTEPVNYTFGGRLKYLDPFTGLEVTRELSPVTLTVKPAPELDLTYFMQRDVYGDDPLTLDVVEPTVPAEFALLINNIGYGDATNVRMVTQQPEIIENEKGLHIDFKLISSQVNGGDAALSFGQRIANDFGTIPAHSQMYAQWWLQSSLLGHFTDYDVKATHVTSYGNEDLSLLGNVTIHELIHGFNMAADEHGQTQRAFLVNDIADANDLPDNLYFSNGDIASVTITTTAEIVRKSSTEYELTITPSAMGWNYGSVMDPTYGYAELKSIVRKSDGKELGSTHFWQTDRTLRDGKDWLYEYRLHFIDEFKGTSPVTYVLTFDPVPDTVLEVKSIGDIPEEGSIAEAPIDALNVTFSKEINATTFTGDDITFAVQGVKKDASQIVISTEDNKTFKLDMKAMSDTLSNGYYTLTVQTAGITDLEGYQGREGKQVGWIMFRGGLVQLLTTAYPENSGTITRKTTGLTGIRGLAPSGEDPNTARYGSTVILMAEPCEGYEFANWTLNGEIVSNEPEYEAFAISDLDIVANFTKKSYMVNVESENEGGTITGSGTGFYEYETTLELTAVPNKDYAFKNWIVNGKTIAGEDGQLTLTVNQTSDVQAVFEREYYRQTMTLAKGWNWISTYLLEPMNVNELTAYANRILSQTEELINDPEYGMIGNIKEFTPGKAYKLEATRMFSSTFRGHLFNAETSSITLKKGWNWIAYPYQEQALIDDVIGNASDGDYITSQIGFAEYSNGSWEGSLDTFIPGNGYLYKSATEKNLSFEFSETVAQSRARAHTTNAQLSNKSIVDIHRYPSTMNMTIQLFRDGMLVSADEYNIYAMANDEIRGVSIQIGDKHYLTVFGADPVEVSFIVESIETGETFEAKEILKFQDDVVGSRKNPFALNIGNGTGIEFMSNDDHPMTIYSLQGVLIGKEATLKMLHSLPKGVYIVNGKKCFIK